MRGKGEMTIGLGLRTVGVLRIGAASVSRCSFSRRSGVKCEIPLLHSKSSFFSRVQVRRQDISSFVLVFIDTAGLLH